MKPEKIWKIIKTALYVIAGILVFIFAEPFVENEGSNINLYVGIVMAAYGLEVIIISLIKKDIKHEPIKFLNALINILLSVIIIFAIEGNEDEVRIACTIWCIWSIMRESEEIFEKVLEGFKEHPITSCINLAESIVVIWFSINLLKVDPSEIVEDALLHVYLLGIELILEVLWPQMSKLEEKIWNRKKKEA